MTADASPRAASSDTQYGLAKIVGIWAAAALPMGILGWVVYPALTPDRVADPFGASITRILLMTAGLIWQFVLALFIVYREEGDLRWSTIRRRLRLNTPLDPETDEPRRKLWLWVIPLVILGIASLQTYGGLLKDLWVRLLPFFAPPPGFDPFEALFASTELRGQLVGAWGFYGLLLVMTVFNILGEEMLFRGVLLPRMEGVFGKWDWVVNGLLFGVFHLHEPWVILPAAIDGAIIFALPAKRLRSTWLPIIAHLAANFILLPLILLVVLGLA